MKINPFRTMLLIILWGQFCVTSAQINRPYPTNPDRKRTFNWLFGDKVWLDYKTNPPAEKSGSQMFALESATSISDTAGNLLLYSDGIRVWNSKHNIINNGYRLNGDSSSSQGCLFIPQPGSDSIIYLFTTDKQGQARGFCYNKIIIGKDPDSTKVVEKNVQLLNYSCESISATRHANGLWTWVAVHDQRGTGMFSFLVTDKGLVKCPVRSDGSFNFQYDIFSCQSKSAFSNDGTLYAISAISSSLIEPMKFNSSKGTFRSLNGYTIYTITPTGINFASNNRYCYAIERDYNIYQSDINQLVSKSIDNHNDNYMIIGSRFNPYNQIMVNIHDSCFLGRIDHPESSNPSFTLRSLPIQGMATNELPNFDNSHYNTPSVGFNYNLRCYDNLAMFNALDTFNANQYRWELRKENSSTWVNLGNGKNIAYRFSDTGSFIIKCIASGSGINDSITKRISIGEPIAKDFLGKDTGYCVGSFPNITLSVPSDMHCFFWNKDSISQSITVTHPGQYIATVISSSFCQMSDTINLYEDFMLPKPAIVRNGDTLSSSIIANQYFWYRNDSLVARDKNFKMTQKGIYKLLIMGQGGCPVWSDTIGIRRLVNVHRLWADKVCLQPNPASDHVNITGLESVDVLSISIWDMQGRIIKKIDLNQGDPLSFTIKELNNGIYYITLKNYDHQKTYKLIKQ